MTINIDDIVHAVCEATMWTNEEARNFLSCITAQSPEGLMESCQSAVEWAASVEIKGSIVSLMKTLPRGVLDAEWTGTEIAIRFNPEATITKDADGTINIDFPESTP